jgi:two-component system sensor histidine kinase MprB
VTFHARLVLVAAIAVIVAVLAAAAASYVAARNSLIGSIDGTLQETATATLTVRSGPFLHVPRTAVAGLDYAFVARTGSESTNAAIPPTTQLKLVESVAANTAGAFFANITVHGSPYREYVISAGQVMLTTRHTGAGIGPVRSALVLVLPLASVESQLARLGFILVLVAIGGILLALVLAAAVARTALTPVHELTAAVEDVAATTDVSKRLDPGGADELGRLRRAFNHLLSALERSHEAQRQLVLDAGHELRTPLTSIRTNLEVVRRLDDLSPDERDVLVDDLLTQMNELTTLVGDLSELARGEQRHVETRILRLDRVVEEAVAIATTHGRPREISFALSTSPTWVRGQRDRLARAVGNLLDNALKWSRDGALVEVACHDGTVIVRDHGPGIAPEDLPHVFDRFYRAPSARSLPGSGLGLAIVAQVAQAEGGSVWAGEAAGGGAEFRFCLPTVSPPSPTSPENEADDE